MQIALTSRVLVDESGHALGWIGGVPLYGGRVWELHPLVVGGSHRRRGIGRALVEDLERLAAPRGGLTLWAGSDDERNETTLGGTDLYPDIPGAIRRISNLRDHPYEFYLRLGFRIAGVLHDANGPREAGHLPRQANWLTRWPCYDPRMEQDRVAWLVPWIAPILATVLLGAGAFTRAVILEERAVNHAFPVLTLNVRFADSDDELLSSYNKGHYTWIYDTVLRDESRIAAVVAAHHLQIQ